MTSYDTNKSAIISASQFRWTSTKVILKWKSGYISVCLAFELGNKCSAPTVLNTHFCSLYNISKQQLGASDQMTWQQYPMHCKVVTSQKKIIRVLFHTGALTQWNLIKENILMIPLLWWRCIHVQYIFNYLAS